jgi:RNA polymerase-binding transcription factor DksA
MESGEARRLLEARRRELEQVRAAARRQLGTAPDDQELATYDQHPADLATDTVEREQFLSEIEMAEDSLRQVDEAFRRLDEGKYGFCDICGKAIPDERLRAIPETQYDVEHSAELAT